MFIRVSGTAERGYLSNAEINTILAVNPKARNWIDEPSHSGIMVYNDVEWVAYMDDAMKAQRTALYKVWNFGGTTDWAVDLAAFTAAETSGLYDDQPQFRGIFLEGEESRKIGNDKDSYCVWRTKDDSSSSCTMPVIAEASENSGYDKWRDMHSDCAWKDFMNWLATSKGSPKRGSFGAAADTFFKGTPAVQCSGVGACSSSVGFYCMTSSGEAGQLGTGPAGHVILNAICQFNLVVLFHGLHGVPVYRILGLINRVGCLAYFQLLRSASEHANQHDSQRRGL